MPSSRDKPVAVAGSRIGIRRALKAGDADLFGFARDYLHAYMPKVRGLSPKTVEAYRISLECFLDYLADTGDVQHEQVSFEHFDRSHLKGWLAWMTDQQHYAPKTVMLRLSAIKAFRPTRPTKTSPSSRSVRQRQLSKRRPVPEQRSPTSAHLKHGPSSPRSAGRQSKSRRNRMLLILLYDTAARVSEITGLTLQDLSLTDPGHVTLTGKGNKTRIVPLTVKTIEHLHVYLAEFHPNTARLPATRPVFYSTHHGQPAELSADTVSAVLKQAAQTARMTCPSIPEKIHCHMLRKTKAMDLYQQGIPLPIIMRLLGHENASTTAAFYAFATLDMMRQAINAATPALDGPATNHLSEDKLQAIYSLR